MNQGKFKIFCLLIIIMLFFTFGIFANPTTENLVSVVIESFDDYNDGGRQWLVQGSRFVTEGLPQQTVVEGAPYALAGNNTEGMYFLGARTAYDRPGYNYLEFIPVKAGEDGNLIHDPVDLPGKVKQLDMWVWGSNYQYYMEIHISDFRGVVHKLPLGYINFAGWRNLRVDFPSYIPQEVRQIPSYKGLSLEKIVLWTTPRENVSNFTVYVDHIKVLTDVFQHRFDGDELANPQTVDSLNWEKRGN